MRIPSGTTDQVVYFVAVDGTDLHTRETGLSSFTVYRSRNGAAAAAMTTPTINETDATNMQGVYQLLLDEDTTIDAGNDTEQMVLHITHAGMDPVTTIVELYRPKITLGNTLTVAADGDLSEVNTLTGHTPQTGDNFARIGAPAGASVSADISNVASALGAVSSNTAAILVDTSTTLDGKLDAVQAVTDQFVFTVANQVDANAIAISGNTTAADNLEDAMTGVVTGAAATGTLSTTQMTTDLTEATDDHYIGRLITFISGDLLGQQTNVTDYEGTGGLLTFTALTEAPSNGDTFVIT
jgi:hypothetical protein